MVRVTVRLNGPNSNTTWTTTALSVANVGSPPNGVSYYATWSFPAPRTTPPVWLVTQDGGFIEHPRFTLKTRSAMVVMYFNSTASSGQNLWLQIQDQTSLTWYSSPAIAFTNGTALYMVFAITGIPNNGSWNCYLTTSLAASTAAPTGNLLLDLRNGVDTADTGTTTPAAAPLYAYVADDIYDTVTSRNWTSFGWVSGGNATHFSAVGFGTGSQSLAQTNTAGTNIIVGIPVPLDGTLLFHGFTTISVMVPTASMMGGGTATTALVVFQEVTLQHQVGIYNFVEYNPGNVSLVDYIVQANNDNFRVQQTIGGTRLPTLVTNATYEYEISSLKLERALGMPLSIATGLSDLTLERTASAMNVSSEQDSDDATLNPPMGGDPQ